MPIIIAGAIAAGGAIAGAKISSNAAKNAAKTQTQAADKAATLQSDLGNKSLDFQRQMYETGRADMMPWMNMGRSALGALGQGMGLQGGSAPAGGPPMGGPGGGGMPLGAMGQQRSLYKAPQMVMMRAPDGSTKQVPMAMAPHFEARGAVRVQ